MYSLVIIISKPLNATAVSSDREQQILYCICHIAITTNKTIKDIKAFSLLSLK